MRKTWILIIIIGIILILIIGFIFFRGVPKEEAEEILKRAREEPKTEEISQQIELTNFKFFPKLISVKKGEIIEFVNIEGRHTVTIDDLNIDKVLNERESFVVTIDQDGIFELTCRFHLSLGMIGTISTGEINQIVDKQDEKLEEAKKMLEKESEISKIEGIQEFEIVQTVYPGKFDPSLIVVKKGILVRIYITTTQREHINRISILPFVSRSDLISPGKVTIIEFTPNEIGEFKIRNIGHGFEGTLQVIE